MLLKAGSFDEALAATADRDFLVRVFQQKPTYKIIKKHLVTQYTDNDRPRETTSGGKKKKSLELKQIIVITMQPSDVILDSMTII
jgi:hypothetical protein